MLADNQAASKARNRVLFIGLAVATIVRQTLAVNAFNADPLR